MRKSPRSKTRWVFSHVEIISSQRSIKTSGLPKPTTQRNHNISSVSPSHDKTPTRKRARKDDDDGLENVEFKHDVEQLKELRARIQDLEESLKEEQVTSLARRNVNADQLTRIQRQAETETLLREELKSVWAETKETIEGIQAAEQRLRAENEKYRKELFTIKSNQDGSLGRVKDLEEESQKLRTTLAETKEALLTATREVKRKDTFIMDLHRQSDQQEEKLRNHNKETSRLESLIETAGTQYWSREREFGAKILAIHETNQQHLKERETTWQAKLQVLESKVLENTHKVPPSSSSFASAMNSPQATNDPRLLRTIHDAKTLEIRVAVLELEKKDLLARVEKLKSQIPVERPSSSASTVETTTSPAAASSTSQAYLKLLRAHELVQKERDLLANKLQEMQQVR